MDSGEPYLPVGDLPYVVRRDWDGIAVVPVLLVGSVVLWVTGVVGPVVGAMLVFFFSFVTVATVVSTIRSGDEAGVLFAVDEEGIYFGDAPREWIPWSVVVTVVMSESEPKGDHDSGRTFWVRVGVPGDSPVEDGRIRYGDFHPDFPAISAALDRHAPPHVQVRRLH